MASARYPARVTKTHLFNLSIPIFLSNIAIPLVGLVDTALMGHLGNVQFLAATSIATSVITMVFWSFGFLRMGTTGLVAQSLGKGDYREIVLIVFRNLSVALFISMILITLQNPILELINNFFKPSINTQLLIKKYISVRIWSAPAELAMYVLVGFYLGLQKTKITSLLISFYSIMNIILSYYLVVDLQLNIYGVALGTVLSAYLTIVIFLLFTFFYIKNKFNIIPRYRKILITKKLIELFNINFDIFVRTILLTFAFLWFTYQSSKISEDYLAVNSILLQFIILAAFFLDSYAFSTEGVVGFAIGRKVKKSFLFVVKNSFKLSFVSGLIISLIYLFFFKNIINILTNLEYLRFLCYGYLFWVLLIPPIASLCYQYDGIFIGASQTAEMRNSMIFSVMVYVILSIILTNYFNNHGLWFSLLIFMILRSLTLRFYFSNILKKF